MRDLIETGAVNSVFNSSYHLLPLSKQREKRGREAKRIRRTKRFVLEDNCCRFDVRDFRLAARPGRADAPVSRRRDASPKVDRALDANRAGETKAKADS